jgi:hypothetical protein
MHFALEMALAWVGCIAIAVCVWPWRPYLAALSWVAVFPAMLVVLRDHPGPLPILLGMVSWIHIVRALDAAASNTELSRARYFEYVLDPTRVPPGEELESAPPFAGERRRLPRGVLLVALFVGLLWLGWQVQPWRVHPYLDDLWVTAEVAIGFTGICDLIYAMQVARKLPLPPLHDPTFPASGSLGEFWGRRWNIMFSRSLRRGVFRGVGGRRRLALGVFATFLVSGLVHGPTQLFASTDLALAGLMAVGGTLFFVVHGAAVLLEGALPRRLRRRLGRPILYGVWALTIPLYPGTGGPCLGLHGRPLTDATILHIPGVAEALGIVVG